MTFFYRFRQIIEWLGILIVMLIFVFPFIWMVTTAFKSLPETTIFPPNLIPNQLLWENFAKAWSSGPFLRYFLNSWIVSVGILALQLLTMVPAAYAFARYNFSGRGFFFGLTMVALMIPHPLSWQFQSVGFGSFDHWSLLMAKNNHSNDK